MNVYVLDGKFASENGLSLPEHQIACFHSFASLHICKRLFLVSCNGCSS